MTHKDQINNNQNIREDYLGNPRSISMLMSRGQEVNIEKIKGHYSEDKRSILRRSAPVQSSKGHRSISRTVVLKLGSAVL